MSDKKTHEEIIKRVCKEILLSNGLFQKGSSRIYLDDNGYFFTHIEFQPSSWGRGSYLNIGICFLWKDRDYFAFDYSPFIAARAKNFVEYQNDTQFEEAMREYAQFALEQALDFRKLRNIKYAKRYFREVCRKIKKHLETLDMIERLDTEDILAAIKKTRSFWHSKPSMKNMPYDSFFDEQKNDFICRSK